MFIVIDILIKAGFTTIFWLYSDFGIYVRYMTEKTYISPKILYMWTVLFVVVHIMSGIL